jgi:hypothetical protein
MGQEVRITPSLTNQESFSTGKLSFCLIATCYLLPCNCLATLIVVESQAAQVIVGKPVVLERGYLVLAGGLPMALGHRETIGIGLAFDEALEGLGIGILGRSEEPTP